MRPAFFLSILFKIIADPLLKLRILLSLCNSNNQLLMAFPFYRQLDSMVWQRLYGAAINKMLINDLQTKK